MDRKERLKQYVQAVPKAELHVHLEGSMRPETLLQLAERNKVDLPVTTVEQARQWFTFRDFPHFTQTFATVARCLRTAADYELLTYELGSQMREQQIRYAEVTVTVSIPHFTFGIPFDTLFRGLQQGRRHAQADFGVQMRWVFDIVRAVRDGKLVERADYTTKVALECKEEGVVALGLGGREAQGPPEVFAPWFEQARSEGLHSVPHAGEVIGPQSVWGALHQLGAERIGHGVRAIEDPHLVTYLAERQIPLEVCPWSNLCLGVYPSLLDHPLVHLSAAGVPLSVNSDDPSLFNTTLTDNLLTLSDPFDLSLSAIDDLVLNGVRQSFLEAEQKQHLEHLFRAEMHRLHNELQLDEPEMMR
jgi:aminodeoxyfutalosine deaminase